MTAVQTAVAKATAPPQAAMPVMRRSTPPSAFAESPLASLSAIPAMPVVQRKCAACEDEQSQVQPRLEVGPVGDRYEMEADSIAAQVMAMRDPRAGARDASAANGAVQRACSACSSSKDEPRARRLGGDPEEEQAKVRASRDGGPETIAASDSQLTGGGAPLPASTRSFFEQRMGRDLSDVRVHQGGGSAAMNDSISARAFTYKNHVWLGAGESASPSFTMAHELAHVMQQTAPGPVGEQAPQRVMRIECDPLDNSLFFAPTDSTREDAEQAFIAKLTTKTGVLGEVPIPNATRGNNGCKAIGKTGRADLMQTNNGNFVGFQFGEEAGAQIPRPWYAPDATVMGCSGMEKKRLVPQSLKDFKDVFVDGVATSPARSGKMVPMFSRGASGAKFSPDAANAPSSIAIGEVKFGGTRSARKGAKAQIDNYRAGIEFSRKGYENIRQNIDSGSNQLDAGEKPKLAAWPTMTTDYLTSIKGVADGWQAQGESKDLITAKYIEVGKKLVPKKCTNIPSTKGKLFHGHDSEFKYVWLYVWYPDTAMPGNATDGSAKFTTHRETAAKLLAQATAAPGATPKVRKLPRGASAAPVKVARKAKPAKPIPAEDPFKAAFPKWKEDRKALSKDFKGFAKTDDFRKDTMRILFNQALKNTTEITGTAPNGVTPDKSDKMVAAEKGLRNLEIMTGPAGGLIGELRFRLGGVFIKILAGYDKLKVKIEELFKKKPAGAGGSSLGARALKVFTKIIGSIASYLLPRVTDALIDCVENGFRETIEKWIDESPLATIEETIQGYTAKAEALKEEIFGDITAFVDELLGPVQTEYNEVKKVIEGVVDIVSLAKAAFDVARAVACLAGGLETAGISCIVAAVDKLLGLVGLSPSEHLMGWLLESCAAKEYFAKAILTYKEVKTIPQKIAKKIVELIGPKLPPWMQSFICDPKTMEGINAELPTWDEVACDGSEGNLNRGGRPSEVGGEVDREPTADEKRDLGGFDVGKNEGLRPKLPTPPPAPTGGTQTPEQPGATPPTPPTGSGASEEGSAPADRQHSATPGVLSGATHRVNVNYGIHSGTSPDANYRGIKPQDVIIKATDSNGVRYGPDPIKVLLKDQTETNGIYKVMFKPVEDTLLNSDGTSLGLTAERWREATFYKRSATVRRPAPSAAK